MKVVICGAGQVGWHIASHMTSRDNDVTIIDSNPELVRYAMDMLDVKGITGFASHPDVLEQANTHDAEMIIAATYSDEVNMIICQIAHSIFKVDQKIARLRDQSYLDALNPELNPANDIPIDVVISPEQEVAEAALRRIQTPGTFETEFFMEDDVQLIGVHIDAACPIVNTPLRQLSELFSSIRTTVVAIRREGALRIANSSDQILPDDSCYMFCHKDEIKRTLEIFGKDIETNNKIVIIGAGNVGFNLASSIEKKGSGTRTRIIEINKTNAERVAERLEKTVVLHGDGLSENILSEASIETAQVILSLTDDDKTNILTAVRAKTMGCPQAICLINDPTLEPLLKKMGIDAHINPRSITVSSILRHIRHVKLRHVYSIGNAEAEVIEAEIMSTSSLAGQRIKEMDFPDGVIIGSVKKGDKIMRPKGDMLIEEGDIIVVFVLNEDVSEIERLLQVRIEYF